MIADEPRLGLIETIYDAALDVTLWPSVLEQLIAITDSQAATFWTLDCADRPKLPLFECVNFDPVFIGEYLDFMAPHDPNVQYLAAHPEQRIVHDASFISEAEKDRNMYYAWHARHCDTRHRVIGKVTPAPLMQAGIALHRTRAEGDFRSETIDCFATLFRHVERALEIGFQLGTLGAIQRASLDILDRNALAIILLDDHGCIVFANRAARALGQKNDGVALSRERITLQRASEDRRLQRLIGDALAATNGLSAVPGGAMLASRPSRRRSYSLLVSPLSRTAFGLTRLRPAVCIAIADPEGCDLLPAERLRVLYGLTPAEARLAERIVLGEDLRKAAAELGIAYPTARTQLAGIFEKTETRRQGELIMLLLRTVPLLAP